MNRPTACQGVIVPVTHGRDCLQREPASPADRRALQMVEHRFQQSAGNRDQRRKRGDVPGSPTRSQLNPAATNEWSAGPSRNRRATCPTPPDPRDAQAGSHETGPDSRNRHQLRHNARLSEDVERVIVARSVWPQAVDTEPPNARRFPTPASPTRTTNPVGAAPRGPGPLTVGQPSGRPPTYRSPRPQTHGREIGRTNRWVSSARSPQGRIRLGSPAARPRQITPMG